jgi:hypothetical protein
VLYRAPMCSSPSVAGLGIRSHSGPGELSIAVVATLPVSDYRVIELGCAPRDNVPRVAQVVSLALPGGARLRVVNTHLTHALTSPLQLARLLARLRQGEAGSRGAPTIIVGDLNMPRLIAGRAPGYKAAVRGRTFPAERAAVQLDHVLTSRDVEKEHGSVLATVGSDHLPIRTQLRIPRHLLSGRWLSGRWLSGRWLSGSSPPDSRPDRDIARMPHAGRTSCSGCRTVSRRRAQRWSQSRQYAAFAAPLESS